MSNNKAAETHAALYYMIQIATQMANKRLQISCLHVLTLSA